MSGERITRRKIMAYMALNSWAVVRACFHGMDVAAIRRYLYGCVPEDSHEKAFGDVVFGDRPVTVEDVAEAIYEELNDATDADDARN